jgi:hypothetical protein
MLGTNGHSVNQLGDTAAEWEITTGSARTDAFSAGCVREKLVCTHVFRCTQFEASALCGTGTAGDGPNRES